MPAPLDIPRTGAKLGSSGAVRHPLAYLFSVDLEDVRTMIPGGERLAERVPATTEALLEFLAGRAVRCTFFTTGDVVRRYPGLVGRIAAAGHEIGCHTSDHTPLDRHTPETFRDDLERCREDFARAGVEGVVGFRAPCASLVRRTSWAYDVLREAGFEYSASVLAARSPLYGWPDFGPDEPCVRNGVWELPTSLTHLPILDVPFVGGVYFRLLPFALVRALFRRRVAAGKPVFGYLHPFDVDTEEEFHAFPEIDRNPLYSRLMYVNRGRVFPRLAALFDEGVEILPYAEYVARCRAAL